MYCAAPLSPRKGRLISFHDDDDDDDNAGSIPSHIVSASAVKADIDTFVVPRHQVVRGIKRCCDTNTYICLSHALGKTARFRCMVTVEHSHAGSHRLA